MKTRIFKVGGSVPQTSNKILPDISDTDIEQFYKMMTPLDANQSKFKGTKREYIYEVAIRMKLFAMFQEVFNEFQQYYLTHGTKSNSKKGGMLKAPASRARFNESITVPIEDVPDLTSDVSRYRTLPQTLPNIGGPDIGETKTEEVLRPSVGVPVGMDDAIDYPADVPASERSEQSQTEIVRRFPSRILRTITGDATGELYNTTVGSTTPLVIYANIIKLYNTTTANVFIDPNPIDITNILDLIREIGFKPNVSEIKMYIKVLQNFRDGLLIYGDGITDRSLIDKILVITMYPFIGDFTRVNGWGTYQRRVYYGFADALNFRTKEQGKLGEYLVRSNERLLNRIGFSPELFSLSKMLFNQDLLESDLMDLQVVRVVGRNHTIKVGEIKTFFEGTRLSFQLTKLMLIIQSYNQDKIIEGANTQRYRLIRENDIIPIILNSAVEESFNRSNVLLADCIPQTYIFDGIKFFEYIQTQPGGNDWIQSILNENLSNYYVVNRSNRIVTRRSGTYPKISNFTCPGFTYRNGTVSFTIEGMKRILKYKINNREAFPDVPQVYVYNRDVNPFTTIEPVYADDNPHISYISRYELHRTSETMKIYRSTIKRPTKTQFSKIGLNVIIEVIKKVLDEEAIDYDNINYNTAYHIIYFIKRKQRSGTDDIERTIQAMINRRPYLAGLASYEELMNQKYNEIWNVEIHGNLNAKLRRSGYTSKLQIEALLFYLIIFLRYKIPETLDDLFRLFKHFIVIKSEDELRDIRLCMRSNLSDEPEFINDCYRAESNQRGIVRQTFIQKVENTVGLYVERYNISNTINPFIVTGVDELIGIINDGIRPVLPQPPPVDDEDDIFTTTDIDIMKLTTAFNKASMAVLQTFADRSVKTGQKLMEELELANPMRREIDISEVAQPPPTTAHPPPAASHPPPRASKK